jgi:PTH1 family peptidyl-tRNA hydrolase
VAVLRRGRADRRSGTAADLLVVGLGNPGAEYEGSRHNVGADAVRLLASRHDGRLKRDKRALADADTVRIAGKRVVLAVPLTYMNDSGQAVAALYRRAGLEEPSALVVVHDELDLEPGRLKVKLAGGLAGHNGLRSIKAHLGTDGFARVRIGVGKPPTKERGADHVLRRPGARDRAVLAQAVGEAADAVEQIVADGLDRAMGAINGVR